MLKVPCATQDNTLQVSHQPLLGPLIYFLLGLLSLTPKSCGGTGLVLAPIPALAQLSLATVMQHHCPACLPSLVPSWLCCCPALSAFCAGISLL